MPVHSPIIRDPFLMSLPRSSFGSGKNKRLRRLSSRKATNPGILLAHAMIWRVVLLSFLSISITCGLVLQTSEEPGSNPISVIHVEQSYTTSPPASDTTIYTPSTEKTRSLSDAATSSGKQYYDSGPQVYLVFTSEL